MASENSAFLFAEEWPELENPDLDYGDPTADDDPDMDDDLEMPCSDRNPLLAMDNTLVTMSSLSLIKGDPNISPETLAQIVEFDRQLLEKKDFRQYRYLLFPHDPQRVYEEHFLAGKACGLAHVSCIIRDRMDSDYARLIATYAIDRDIPFLVGAILLNDLLAVDGTFRYYRRLWSGEYVLRDWKPVPARVTPPVNFEKLAKSGYESCIGANDKYTVQAYIEGGYTMVGAAKKLNISRVTVASRLKKCGFIDENGKCPKDIDAWFEQKHLESDEMSGLFSGDERIPEKETLLKKSRSVIEPPVLNLAVSYYRNGKNIEATAAENNVPSGLITEILLPNLRTKYGIMPLAIAAAEVICGSNESACADLLDVTPDWYRKKSQTEHLAYRMEIEREMAGVL